MIAGPYRINEGRSLTRGVQSVMSSSSTTAADAAFCAGLFKYILGHASTIATTRGNPKLIVQITDRAGALRDRISDLRFGNSLADTNVHAAIMIANENDCQ